MDFNRWRCLEDVEDGVREEARRSRSEEVGITDEGQGQHRHAVRKVGFADVEAGGDSVMELRAALEAASMPRAGAVRQ